MNRLVNLKTAKWIAFLLSLSFLAVHIIMLVMFALCSVIPMVYFNIFSVIFYAVMAVLVGKLGMFRSFAALVYMEVLLHMSTAVCLTGWGSGFQNTLIGMSVIFFYFEYMARCLKLPYLRALPFCVFGMFTYLFLWFFVNRSEPPYVLPAGVSFGMQIFWGIVVWVVTIARWYRFVSLSVGTYDFLSQKVKRDQLTNLPNRYFISDYLDELEKKTGLDKHWIALIDIDDFKKVNDTYGHNCGDIVLKEVASLLQESLVGDVASRWGGEEFILLGRDEANLEEKLNRMRKTIENHAFMHEGKELHVTVTIGVAQYKPSDDIRQWIGEADQRMYMGKQQGKNRVVMTAWIKGGESHVSV